MTFDREKLKALPRRLKIVFAVILAELIVIMGAYVLGDELDEREARVVQLRSQLTQARQQTADLRRQIDQYPELRRRYDAAIEKGIAGNLDAVKLITDAQDSAARHYLANLRYKVEPLVQKGTAAEKYRIGATLVNFESGAVLDTDAMAFWDEILRSLPSHYHIVEASLERTGEIDANLLNNLRAGRPVSAVRVKMSFQWLSLHSTMPEAP